MNRSDSGTCIRRNAHNAVEPRMKAEMAKRIGPSRIPQGVKFRDNPIKTTMQMLSPILSAMRSTASNSSFLGKSAATSKYPGINRTKGNPTTARRGEELNGGTVMITADTTTNAMITNRSFIPANPFSKEKGFTEKDGLFLNITIT